MTAAVRIPVMQGSAAWIAARRALVTATDIGVLLGVNPWKCERDLADEKLGLADPVESNIRMRIGTALEPLIAAEYEAATGRRVRRVHGLWRHPTIEWAGASPDFTVVGEARLLETKWSGSRTRFADGLPDDVAAQATWQCFVGGYPACDVAALVGDEVRIFEVEADPGLADDLVAIAADFRARLAAGGPFAANSARIRRDYPSDNGAELLADQYLDATVRRLVETRAQRKTLEASEAALEDAVKLRMGEFAVLRGQSWYVNWKRTKDRKETDWRLLADGLLRQLSETEREALVGLHSSVRQGFRPFRLVMDQEDQT